MVQRISALLTSVFCTSTITPTEASTRDSSSTARMASKNVPPPPPYCSGNLDAHQSQLEEVLDQRRLEHALLVHLLDVRPDRLIGKLANGVAKQGFVFSKLTSGAGGISVAVMSGMA